jgi:hypothetical protein
VENTNQRQPISDLHLENEQAIPVEPPKEQNVPNKTEILQK